MAGTLGDLGEDAWIRRLVRRLGDQAPPPPEGIGDDASRLRSRAGGDLLWSTDLLVEEVHFRRSWTTPRMLGRKALAVNLSDVAAMGGRPRGFLLGLSVPGSTPVSWLDGLVTGLADTARREKAPCLGGDSTGSPGPITLSITAAGDLPSGRLLSRRGGRPGDGLWVSGFLGASAAGLRVLESGIPTDPSSRLRRAIASVLRVHRDPRPPLGLGPWLAHRGLARAAMDLSDGLARDLPRLCAASGLGARIDAAAMPVHPAVAPVAAFLGCDPLHLALLGGEDYELLFAVSPRKEPELRRVAGPRRLTRIGRFIEPHPGGPGDRGPVRLRAEDGTEQPLAPGGFRHFDPGAGREA